MVNSLILTSWKVAIVQDVHFKCVFHQHLIIYKIENHCQWKLFICLFVHNVRHILTHLQKWYEESRENSNTAGKLIFKMLIKNMF